MAEFLKDYFIYEAKYLKKVWSIVGNVTVTKIITYGINVRYKYTTPI